MLKVFWEKLFTAARIPSAVINFWGLRFLTNGVWERLLFITPTIFPKLAESLEMPDTTPFISLTTKVETKIIGVTIMTAMIRQVMLELIPFLFFVILRIFL